MSRYVFTTLQDWHDNSNRHSETSSKTVSLHTKVALIQQGAAYLFAGLLDLTAHDELVKYEIHLSHKSKVMA